MTSSSTYNLCQAENQQASRMWKARKNTQDIAERLGVHQACVARAMAEIIKAVHIEKEKAA